MKIKFCHREMIEEISKCFVKLVEKKGSKFIQSTRIVIVRSSTALTMLEERDKEIRVSVRYV